jgi:hypothetical protein
MGKNREQKKDKRYNRKSSPKNVLNSKYIRKKIANTERNERGYRWVGGRRNVLFAVCFFGIKVPKMKRLVK